MASIPRCAQGKARIAHDEEGRLPGRPPMSKAEALGVLFSALQICRRIPVLKRAKELRKGMYRRSS